MSPFTIKNQPVAKRELYVILVSCPEKKGIQNQDVLLLAFISDAVMSIREFC